LSGIQDFSSETAIMDARSRPTSARGRPAEPAPDRPPRGSQDQRQSRRPGYRCPSRGPHPNGDHGPAGRHRHRVWLRWRDGPVAVWPISERQPVPGDDRCLCTILPVCGHYRAQTAIMDRPWTPLNNRSQTRAKSGIPATAATPTAGPPPATPGHDHRFGSIVPDSRPFAAKTMIMNRDDNPRHTQGASTSYADSPAQPSPRPWQSHRQSRTQRRSWTRRAATGADHIGYCAGS
jgi:hypothetical protein